MKQRTGRLYFIDAMRAWAILMMLQGHFVDGLLDNSFRDDANWAYATWKYFRGITAPVFFTVSGFIFTFLLTRTDRIGKNNPRVKKGLKRGVQLLLIGYLLRTNFGGLFKGHIYGGFYLVDVLHCIGLSLIGIIIIYLVSYRSIKYIFPSLLLVISLLLFLLEPQYKALSYSFLPEALANYFTRANGSVFTVIPWFGYAAIGGFLSTLFNRFKDAKHLYIYTISIASIAGLWLIYKSSAFFVNMERWTGLELFKGVYSNNYLFIRLGDVLLVFAVFMLLRRLMENKTLLKIGQSTLSIYVVHFIILYGSFTGMGLYRYFNHSLAPQVVIPCAILFMFICTFIALQYEKYKETIKGLLLTLRKYFWEHLKAWYRMGIQLLKRR
ncbi:putative membrane protein [Saonia flava]|uniref:Putative membrane protein n=1 Tax=Saonia flava TaxID=523696 RepID=A0A846QPR4_9FLAO|nr:acyltransferase family protein [Saonia flava]NJB70098.1 putative membrane protein [Saonia flava]